MRTSMVAHLTVAGLLAVASLGGCKRTDTCVGGDDGRCRPRSPCQALRYECADRSLELRRLNDAASRPPGVSALAAAGDILIGNGRVVAVIDALESPHHLAPSGGGLLDLAARDAGGVDLLNHVYQVAGILPRDAVRYRKLELVDESPSFVAVVLRGELDGLPGVLVVTRYEVRPCEPGIRIRTELFHGGRDPQTLFLADGFYWGNRTFTPFAPLRGQGFTHPELDLKTIGDAFRTVPWMAAQGHGGTGDGASYGVVPCGRRTLDGFQTEVITAAGLPRRILLPGDGLAYERFLFVAAGPGLQGAVNRALEARRQLFGEPYVQLSGRAVLPGGTPVGGDERLASLLLYAPGAGSAPDDPATRIPMAEVVPKADGRFSVRVPRQPAIRIQPHALGRARGEVAQVTVAADAEKVEIGDVVVPAMGRLSVAVLDANGQPQRAEVVLTPRDSTARAETLGTLYGNYPRRRCGPYLGPPHGASPACNRVLVDATHDTSFSVPPGEYHLYAHRGPFHTISRTTVRVGAGETVDATLTVVPLAGLLPAGALSADFHVHAGASMDSVLPETDRARSFVTSGVQVIAATDHDVVTNYQAAIAALGIGDQVEVMPGVETTSQVLFLRPPGSELPTLVGHFNFWPLVYDPNLPRNGAPHDELLEPGGLFDRFAGLFDGEGVIQLNHPYEEGGVLNEGYLSGIGYDPRNPVPTVPDGSEAGQLVRRPGGGHRNIDHHVQEVMNGNSVAKFIKYRSVWFSFLNQGILRGGTANSDSHTLADQVLGYPRTLVFGGHALGAFDRDRFNRDVRQGRMVGTNGPVLLVSVRGADGQQHGPSLGAFQPAPNATLDIAVRAAPWIPVQEVRIIVNGRTVRTIGSSELLHPADPFGRADTRRLTASLPLSELLNEAGTKRDCWIVVEAGLPLPRNGDVDDDGVPDTTDNNGDGVVDEADRVEEAPAEDLDGDGVINDDDVPEVFREPAPPATEADPRYHLDIIAPGTYPTAFTNPLLIDVDGDGWKAPGLRRQRARRKGAREGLR